MNKKPQTQKIKSFCNSVEQMKYICIYIYMYIFLMKKIHNADRNKRLLCLCECCFFFLCATYLGNMIVAH